MHRFVNSCLYDCCCSSSNSTSGSDRSSIHSSSWSSTMHMSCDAGISSRPSYSSIIFFRSILSTTKTSPSSLSCHSDVSVLQTVDLVSSVWEPLSVWGQAIPLMRRVRFLHLPQFFHWDADPAADLFHLLGLHSQHSFPWCFFH